MTGGMAFEALNDVGRSPNNMIIILNDNGMSISKMWADFPNISARSGPNHSTIKQEKTWILSCRGCLP